MVDAINGDSFLITRGDRSELVRELIGTVLQAREDLHEPPLAIYEQDSRGPFEAATAPAVDAPK